MAKAAAHTNVQAAGKLTRLVDGQPRFVRQPPVLERLVDLLPDDQRQRLEHGLVELVASYAESLLPEQDIFDRAIVRFSEAYADQTGRDHAALVQAIREDRLSALAGV